jgi:hypothetical protein
MMLEALGSAAARTLILALMVQVVLWVARVRHPQLLRVAWTAVLAASLAMPVLRRAMPITVSAPVRVFAPVTAIAFPEGVAVASAAPTGATGSVPSPRPESWMRWLSAGYCVVTSVLLLRLLAGLALSWRLLRLASPVRPAWAAGCRVRASTAIHAPATMFRTIVVPADHGDWPATTRNAVLAHERAHLEGGDFLIQILAQVNQAVFWFSPLSWWLRRRLMALAELVADDAAIEVLGDGPGYASVLLEMAGRAAPMAVAIAMARPATVRRRIERILANRVAPTRVGWLRRAAIALSVAPLAAAAAGSVAGAAPPDRAALDAEREPHAPIAIDPKLLDAYAGFYRDSRTGSVMIVTRDGDHLMTRRAGYPPVPEYPYSDHDFFLTIAPQQNTFVTDASGAVTGVVHHQFGRDETLERISAEAAQRDVAAVEQRRSAEQAPHVEVAIDPKLLDGYVGAYQLTPRLIFTVTRDGDALYARVTGQVAYRVRPYGDRDFFYTVVAAQLSFVPGDDGKASAMILHQNGRDRTAKRVDPALAEALDRRLAEERAAHAVVAISPGLIDFYVGRYRNADMEITATREGEQLFVQVTGFPRYAVYPYSDHDFFATVMPAQITFATDATGKATQLIRHQFGVDAVLNRVD